MTRIADLKVRPALALWTDRAAYVGALGGDDGSSPSLSIVNPATPGYVANKNFGSRRGSRHRRCEALLEESGETASVPDQANLPIGSDTSEKAIAGSQGT